MHLDFVGLRDRHSVVALFARAGECHGNTLRGAAYRSSTNSDSLCFSLL